MIRGWTEGDFTDESGEALPRGIVRGDGDELEFEVPAFLFRGQRLTSEALGEWVVYDARRAQGHRYSWARLEAPAAFEARQAAEAIQIDPSASSAPGAVGAASEGGLASSLATPAPESEPPPPPQEPELEPDPDRDADADPAAES